MLARSDREVAAVLFESMDNDDRSIPADNKRQDEFSAVSVVGGACIDPRAAVELLQSPTASHKLSGNPGCLEGSAGRMCLGAISMAPGEC
jgi:hypothetical protein